MDEYEKVKEDQLQRMHERAVEHVAVKIKGLLADQWRPLLEAGWSNEDIAVILDQALEQCNSKP